MTSLIVSDSGPLISFARAGKLHIVQGVYGKIIIPPEVYNEIVVRGSGKPGAEEIKQATWIEVRGPKNQAEVTKLIGGKFHLGESEAVILATELSVTLLVDEEIVIKEARRRGIRITSTLLTLEIAKASGLIISVKDELNELIAKGFRATPELIKDTLQRVGE